MDQPSADLAPQSLGARFYSPKTHIAADNQCAPPKRSLRTEEDTEANYDDIKLAGKDVRLAGTQLLIGPRKDAE
jgi:hypothetical protein